MKQILIILHLLVFLFACGTKEVEKVEVTFDSGKSKLVANYKIIKEKEVKVYEKELYENGKTKMEGAIEDGKRVGKWKVHFEDGTLWSEGEYIEGKRSGTAKNYYPNGKLRYEGQFKEDKKIGRWKFYNEQGQLIEEKDF